MQQSKYLLNLYKIHPNLAVYDVQTNIKGFKAQIFPSPEKLFIIFLKKKYLKGQCIFNSE